MSESQRYIEDGESVHFVKTGSLHHRSFINTYRGMSIPQARRKMKSLWASRSLQNEMIHYLKEKCHVRS
jgi:hypothetical protein